MFYHTNDQYMISVIDTFWEFLSTEALLESIESSKQEWDIVSVFNVDEKTVTFSLKK